MNDNYAIKVNNLKRVYFQKKSNEKIALKNINLKVNRGEIFGLLGPNGAGKSTTIKILTTMLLPTSGTVEVLGYNVQNEEQYIRGKINFVFGGERNLYWRLSAYDNLVYFADLYKVPKHEYAPLIINLLKLVGLFEEKDNKVETFSKGMKQRLQIARALINDPEIIFLDEPSLGLDPVGAYELRMIIKRLKERGKTVLLTTHYMPEAEELCDRIAIINNGEILTVGTLKEIEKLIPDKEKNKILDEKTRSKSEISVTLEDIYLSIVGGT